jgi:ribosome biogenesis protein SSF1/2
MPKSGSKRKKTRTHVEDTAAKEEYDNAPKSFIIKRGKIGIFMRELLHNLRELMYPYTFMNLKESKKNSMKDFLGAAGQFGVSHMILLTQTEKSNYMRLIKNPKGPTVTMKIDEYALSKDVVAHQ